MAGCAVCGCGREGREDIEEHNNVRRLEIPSKSCCQISGQRSLQQRSKA